MATEEEKDKLRLRYRRLDVHFYAGCGLPFYLVAWANDGNRYHVGAVEIQRCRCAGWTRSAREYVEDERIYREETWSGPGSGIAFVTSEKERVMEWRGTT